MTSSSGSKRPRPVRRWVGALLAVVLLPVGAALLLYSFASRESNPDAAPFPSLSPSVVSSPVAGTPIPSSGGSASAAPPEPTYVAVTTYITVPMTAPRSDSNDVDVLSLVTTITGLLASVAGIVSAVVSARAPRRQ
jgi:hypothetical protein